MKPLLAVLVATSLCVSSAAFAGRLSIYSDAALSDCTLMDASPGVVHVYVADLSPGWDGITGARFRIVASEGFTGVWLSETSPYAHIGDSRTDFAVGYTYCLVGQLLVLDMTYQLFGTSTCSTVSIAGALGGYPVICTYCSFGEYPCTGLDPLHVNCPGPFNCGPVATEPSTWGKVKALYRN